MQQPSESRMRSGSCLRDSTERSSNLARAAYLARASTWVMTRISFLVDGLASLGRESDENPHRNNRADHAEEYGGSCLRLRDAVLQSKHDHYRHGWNRRCQHRLADNGFAIADPPQSTQDQGGLKDVFQEYEKPDVRVGFHFARCEHDAARKQGDAPGGASQQRKRVDDELRNMEPAQHDDESENGCPNNRLFDRFRKFGCERRQMLLVLRSQARSR